MRVWERPAAVVGGHHACHHACQQCSPSRWRARHGVVDLCSDQVSQPGAMAWSNASRRGASPTICQQQHAGACPGASAQCPAGQSVRGIVRVRGLSQRLVSRENESVRRPPCLPAAACQNQPRRWRPVPSRWRPRLPQAWLPAACQLHPVPSRPQAWLPAAQRRQHQLRLRRPAPSHGQVEQAALRQHPSRWRVCHVPSHPQAWLPAAQRRQRQLRLRHPAPSHWQVEQAALRHHPSRWRVCHWAPKLHCAH